MATTRLITADDLLEMELEPGRYDLIDGELHHMAPAGDRHGETTLLISIPMGHYVYENDLGIVYAAETGFVLAADPDVVVAPDFAFVRKGRLSADRDGRGFVRLVPDLAVEVVSPSDYPRLVQTKIEKYLNAAIPLLLVVYRDSRIVDVYRNGHGPETIGVGEVLDGGDVLPGFRLAVAGIFR